MTGLGGIAAHGAGSTGGDLAGSFRHSRILRATAGRAIWREAVRVDIGRRTDGSRWPRSKATPLGWGDGGLEGDMGLSQDGPTGSSQQANP